MVLNPATPAESIAEYAHLLDKVTVMSVDPAMPDKSLFLSR
nr:allulose-6-phosphate 3-epimerase [Klebsiella pneumoniae]